MEIKELEDKVRVHTDKPWTLVLIYFYAEPLNEILYLEITERHGDKIKMHFLIIRPIFFERKKQLRWSLHYWIL